MLLETKMSKQKLIMTKTNDIMNISKAVSNFSSSFKIFTFRASLVAQWLRICLLMQGTRVRALIWEDPTCRGATGPVSHNY